MPGIARRLVKSSSLNSLASNATLNSIPEYSAPPPEIAAKPRNHGDSDVAPDGVPSQFLLLRGLDSSVTEELLAKGVAKLYKPSNSDGQNANAKKGAKVVSTTGNSNLGAREGSIRRVLLVRDRKSNDSWGYGFAEYATVEVRRFQS